jgi:hypothetical protein
MSAKFWNKRLNGMALEELHTEYNIRIDLKKIGYESMK